MGRFSIEKLRSRRRTVLGLVLLSLTTMVPAHGRGQEPTPESSPPEASSESERERAEPNGAAVVAELASRREERAARLSLHASHIRALMAGQLDPSVDERSLFEIDLDDVLLTGDRGERLLQLFRDVQQSRAVRRRRRRRPTPSTGDPLDDAVQQLTQAFTDFLALSPERRAELLDAHAERRIDARKDRERSQARRERVQAQTEALRDLLAGRLALSADPAELLRINLADEEGLSRPDRTRRILNAASHGGTPELPAEIAALERAEAELDRLRLQLLRLSAPERAALRERHAERQRIAAESTESERQQAAEEAARAELSDTARAREDALRAARDAEDERLRRIAEERARLLGVKQSYARVAADIEAQVGERTGRDTQALDLRERASALVARSLLAGDKEREAEALYAQLGEALADGRQALELALDTTQESSVVLEEPGDDALSDLEDGEDLTSLRELRLEVATLGATVANREREVRQEVARAAADDIVMLNRTRLELLDLVGPELQSRVTGMGGDGMRQTQREGWHILLVGRHALSTLPTRGTALIAEIRSAPLPLIWAFLKLMGILFLFSWWRSRADGLLENLSTPPEGRSSSSLNGLAWYARRVRRPLEWLGLVWTLLSYTAAGGLGQQIPWTMALWIFGGNAAILLVDAIADRQKRGRRRGSNVAELRLRSLKVVGRTIVVIGLVLDLTELVVGRGAIYAWALRAMWLIAIPIGILLARWWRATIFRELDLQRDPSMLVRGLKLRRKGMLSVPAAAVGGVYLLAIGLLRWVIRVASTMDGTRRLRAHLFRRQVARRAELVSGTRTPIKKEIYDAFAPSAEPTELVPEFAQKEVDRLASLLDEHEASVSAIIGERGAGRSTFITRLAMGLECPFFIVRSGPTWESFLEALYEEVGVDSRGALFRELRKTGAVVFVDDAHMVARPAIGGLDELDKVTDLARRSGTRWVLSLERAAWQYISRARDELYDCVVSLPRWREAQIASLLRIRTKHAGVSPSFDALEVPRQIGAPPQEDDAQQKEEGYYRVLWDFSDGNPAVALHFWRESLFLSESAEKAGSVDVAESSETVKSAEAAKSSESVESSETVKSPETLKPEGPVVKLFREPPVADLEALPPIVVYVLRTVVQLGRASAREVVACTSLPDDEVADALRLALSRGYIERHEGRIRVSWAWYRSVTGLLKRRNLLVIA